MSLLVPAVISLAIIAQMLPDQLSFTPIIHLHSLRRRPSSNSGAAKEKGQVVQPSRYPRLKRFIIFKLIVSALT
jgi:hypothetical protein